MRKMFTLLRVCCAVAMCVAAMSAWSQGPINAAAKRAEKFAQLDAEKAQSKSADQIQIQKSNGGYLGALISPQGAGFRVPGVDQADPKAVSEGFLKRWADVIHNPSAQIQYKPIYTEDDQGVTVVRFQQTYQGLDIYKAQVTVQVDKAGQVRHVLSGSVTDTSDLDTGKLQTEPTLDADMAELAAIVFEAEQYKTFDPDKFSAVTKKLVVFAPNVMGAPEGPLALCWVVVVSYPTEQPYEQLVFVDAHSGKGVFHYSLVSRVMRVYDMTGYSYPSVGLLWREGADSDTGILPVDLGFYLTYDMECFIINRHYWYLGDHMNDYWIKLSVDMSSPLNYEYQAFWSPTSEWFWFGSGVLTDDVLGHEFTHAVTEKRGVSLGNTGEQGAVNEAFSDMWGEWFDLNNNYSNFYGYTNDDSSSARWLIGEDAETFFQDIAIRDMKNPASFLDSSLSAMYGEDIYYPDYYKRSGYWDAPAYPYIPEPHHNSTVGGKLGYLLTDGGTFNGYSVTSLGWSEAEYLMWGAQGSIVPADRCYYKLYDALLTSANNRGYNSTQMLNLNKACQAVGIRNYSGTGQIIRNDSNQIVAIIEDSGLIRLKRGLTVNDTNIDTSNGGWYILTPDYWTIIYVDTSAGNDGHMYIRGSMTQNTIPNQTYPYFFENWSWQNVRVQTIDEVGNMTIWGSVIENDPSLQ